MRARVEDWVEASLCKEAEAHAATNSSADSHLND